MNADRSAQPSTGGQTWFQTVSNRINWKSVNWWIALSIVLVVGATSAFPFMTSEEARHAGIAHDMWAARQYVVPRINGFPVLDGSPLFYWIAIIPLRIVAHAEWSLRLVSALAAGATLLALSMSFRPWPHRHTSIALICLFLMQPPLMVASRYATPDMLSLFLLVVAVGGFYRALNRDPGEESAWNFVVPSLSAGLLGLAAGMLAPVIPVVIMLVWLAVRGRLDLMWKFITTPALLLVVLIQLPWLWEINERYPGMVATMLVQQLRTLGGQGRNVWVEYSGFGCWLWVMVASLPLLACLVRCRNPARREVLRTPLGGLMAVWALSMLLLHPLMAFSETGHMLALLPPLLVVAALIMAPAPGDTPMGTMLAWTPTLVLSLCVAWVGADTFTDTRDDIVPITRSVAERYNDNTDKIIMLDRYFHDFNFYLQSPKLVYVAADWSPSAKGRLGSSLAELASAAPFVPEVASRMLLSTGSGGQVNTLMERLCERRAVNLWVVGSAEASQRHPILDDLTLYASSGRLRVWYLPANVEPEKCRGRNASQ